MSGSSGGVHPEMARILPACGKTGACAPSSLSRPVKCTEFQTCPGIRTGMCGNSSRACRPSSNKHFFSSSSFCISFRMLCHPFPAISLPPDRKKTDGIFIAQCFMMCGMLHFPATGTITISGGLCYDGSNTSSKNGFYRPALYTGVSGGRGRAPVYPSRQGPKI